jgi:hypothetical protein
MMKQLNFPMRPTMMLQQLRKNQGKTKRLSFQAQLMTTNLQLVQILQRMIELMIARKMKIPL